MLSVLLDTNVLLDSMLPARPQHAEAARLVRLSSEGRLRAMVSAGSLKDVYYVTRKHVDDATARGFLGVFLDVFEVLPLDATACREALGSDEPDFEDGVVRAVAEAAGADLVVTRDAAAFAGSRMAKSDAAALLSLVDPEFGREAAAGGAR